MYRNSTHQGGRPRPRIPFLTPGGGARRNYSMMTIINLLVCLGFDGVVCVHEQGGAQTRRCIANKTRILLMEEHVPIPTACYRHGFPLVSAFLHAQHWHDTSSQVSSPPIRRCHPYARKAASKTVLSRMHLILHETRRTPHGASRLVQVAPAWSVKTLRAPFCRCRDMRVYGHTTTATHEDE